MSERNKQVSRPLGLLSCTARPARRSPTPRSEYVRRVAPHIAEGIRSGLLAASVEACDPADAPGLLLLAPDGSLVSTTAAGRRAGQYSGGRWRAGRWPGPGSSTREAPPRPLKSAPLRRRTVVGNCQRRGGRG